MQGTYQLDREVFDTEIMFNDSCQVIILVIFFKLRLRNEINEEYKNKNIGCDERNRHAKQRLF
jgi:hypothetical protein